MAASIRLAFGRFSRRRNNRPSASYQILSGLRSQLCPRPRLNAFGELVAPRRVGGERAAQRHEIDLAAGFARAFVEGAEAGASFRHHVERKPVARIFLVGVPGVELRLAQLLDRLRRAFGEGIEQLGAQRFDPLVEQAEIDCAAFQQRLAFGSSRARLGLAVNDAPILIEESIGRSLSGWRRTCRQLSAPARSR